MAGACGKSESSADKSRVEEKKGSKRKILYNSKKNKTSPRNLVLAPRADLNLMCERLVRYFFITGTTTQPEVDSVNSLAEKHQMTTFLPLIQAASLAALR